MYINLIDALNQAIEDQQDWIATHAENYRRDRSDERLARDLAELARIERLVH